MKATLPLLPLIIFFLSGKVQAQFQYVSPVPGSKLHNPETNIILRPGSIIEAASVQAGLFQVEGSLSGNHECIVKLADGNRVVILEPKTPFLEGEDVSVTVDDGMQTNGRTIKGTSFSFQIHPPRTAEQK